MKQKFSFTDAIPRYQAAWNRLQRRKQELRAQRDAAERSGKMTQEHRCALNRRIRILREEQAEIEADLRVMREYAAQETAS